MSVGRSGQKPTHRLRFACYIGFYAGLLWGGMKLAQYYLKFTTIIPGFLIEPFYKHQFLLTWQGQLLGWGSFIVFSIAASLMYLLFAGIPGPWPGMVYGLAWWCILYLLVGPYSGMMKWITQLGWNTIIVDLCLFLVWGLFIGYSLSFEFTDIRAQEPQKTQNNE